MTKEKSSKFFSTIVNVLSKLIHMLQMISVPPIFFLCMHAFIHSFFLSSLIYRVDQLTDRRHNHTHTHTLQLSLRYSSVHIHTHRLLSVSLISISLFYSSNKSMHGRGRRRREKVLFSSNLHFRRFMIACMLKFSCYGKGE